MVKFYSFAQIPLDNIHQPYVRTLVIFLVKFPAFFYLMFGLSHHIVYTCNSFEFYPLFLCILLKALFSAAIDKNYVSFFRFPL